MKMKNTKYLNYTFAMLLICILIFSSVSVHAEVLGEDVGQMISKEDREQLVETDYGAISAVDFTDGIRGTYHLEFIKMEPNSLFLPVQLHADMMLFVHTGSGKLVWTDGDDLRRVDLRRGEICRVHPGSVFYIQSNLEQERERLRIHAIFTSTDEEIYEQRIGPYSGISDLYTGFDKRVLQAALKVSEEVIEEITNASKPQAIVHALPEQEPEPTFWESEARFLKAFLGGDGTFDPNSNKEKKGNSYNIFDRDPDVENCYGWSRKLTRKKYHQLKGSHIGIFMVNLTKGSMMGPHWNPTATEIAVVLEGQGMVRVVCASGIKDSNCKNMRFRVKEGDVFSVPRFHPMAQISFNNDSFAFMGFSSTTRKNYPQFLAGRNSVLQTLDRKILELSFNVSNTTIDQVLAAQDDSIILECTSCAEEEEMIMEEEIQKEKEEARKKEEEASRQREEEEDRRRREEEEERRRREEEERRRVEEERRRRREEEERRREEERKKQEEEEAQRRERETRQQEEEEEAERQWREEEQREEEQARRREEEAARRQGRERRRREREEAERPRREEGGSRGQPEERRRQEPGTSEEGAEARREEEERQRRARQEGARGGRHRAANNDRKEDEIWRVQP